VALLDVILGYDCNLGCDYCTITPEMRRRAMPPERVLAAMRSARAQGYDEISFTGGEPTIRPDLVPLLRAAKALGFTDLKVQTNGLLLGPPGNLQRLLDAGLTRLHVSIHTHDERRYDALVQREGAWPMMVAGLDAAVRSGVTLAVDLILKEDTYRALPDAVRWLAGRGVKALNLWYVSLTDGNAANVASLPRMTEVAPVMAEAFRLGRELNLEVRSLHVPRCLLGADHDRAFDPGAGRVMVVSPEATFELKDSRLAGQTHVAACEGCRFREVCPGVRPDYLARHGEAELKAVPP